jgi:hypothetical protein
MAMAMARTRRALALASAPAPDQPFMGYYILQYSIMYINRDGITVQSK